MKHLRRFLNSSMGYLPFKIIEGVFGIIALSLYSYILTPNDYGDYGIVNVTVMLTYLVTIGWFNFVATRYVSEQNTEDAKKEFYSNILSLQGMILTGLFVLYLIFAAWLIYSRSYNINLLLLYIMFFLGYTFNQFYIYLLLYVNKRFMNVLLMLITSVLRPTFVFVLYKMGVNIMYIIFLGHGVADLLLGLIAFRSVGAYKYFDKTYINKEKFKSYFSYGFPLIGLTLTMYILNISDRYLIKIFHSKYEVGIYVPNYSIASATFLMISYGLSRGFYPKLLAQWKNNNKVVAGEILAKSVKNFLFLGLPAATGMMVLSRDIGSAFISKEYASGYLIIGIVAFGMFFLGLAEYANKEWELAGNTLPIFKNSVKAAIINLVLNFIFIPFYGFMAAAFTTCFSFIIYAFLCYKNRKKELVYKLKQGEILGILSATVIMGVCVWGASYIPLTGLVALLVKVSIGVVSYMIVILSTNVYPELKTILKGLRQ